MTNANSNFGKPTAQEAREQLIALGGKITSTVLEINGHCSSITMEDGAGGTAFRVACLDYTLPREYRDAMEDLEFASAADAKAFLEVALDIYDDSKALMLGRLGKLAESARTLNAIPHHESESDKA